jgi:hypothetical protein
MDKPTRRHIAPRLRSGLRRIPNSGALPPHIKHALQMVARARGESVSWVMEQVIYSHFGIPAPKYIGTREPDPVVAAPPKLKYPRSA